MSDYDVAVIGGGHNGLACACYLARAGYDVVVLEQADRIGGAVHTAETIPEVPGYYFDTGSVVHNLIHMTSVIDELQLRKAGLEYVETNPFTTSVFPGGRCARFYRSVDRTCDEIAGFSPPDAEAYHTFVELADPIADLSLGFFRASEDRHRLLKEWRRRLVDLGKVLRRRRPLDLANLLAQPYGTVLRQTFETELVRTGLIALAAHASLGPQIPGSAFFVFWQAAYHRYGNWHAKGGSGALARSMARRLEAWGGEIYTSAEVGQILVDGVVQGIELADGSTIGAPRVVAAVNPQTALLDLLGEAHLPETMASRVRALHRSNATHFVVNVALDGLPPWPNAPDDVWNGLQSTGTSLQQYEENFLRAEAGLAPRDPAVYVYTPSAIDEAVAPAGKHTAYLACASYPARFSDGSSWDDRGAEEAERLIDVVEQRAPGFKSEINGFTWFHARDWERTFGLVGGHPMHIDITPDQTGPLRPLPALRKHRGPVPGLYLSGAGTAPTGGVSAVPGRAAAKRLISDDR